MPSRRRRGRSDSQTPSTCTSCASAEATNAVSDSKDGRRDVPKPMQTTFAEQCTEEFLKEFVIQAEKSLDPLVRSGSRGKRLDQAREEASRIAMQRMRERQMEVLASPENKLASCEDTEKVIGSFLGPTDGLPTARDLKLRALRREAQVSAVEEAHARRALTDLLGRAERQIDRAARKDRSSLGVSHWICRSRNGRSGASNSARWFAYRMNPHTSICAP